MTQKIDYAKKFSAFSKQTYFDQLPSHQQMLVRELAFQYRLTFQELRQLVEAAHDLNLWGEADLVAWWQSQAPSDTTRSKKAFLHSLQQHLLQLKRSAKVYPAAGLKNPGDRPTIQIVATSSDKKIYGLCPVASDKTLCCQLRTIDAVEKCVYGCSYCTIQTFYQDQIALDPDFGEKLKAIQLEPQRFYHFGTGQASDSLALGNRNGILDAVCQFAADHPNILLELKTKSDKIHYFLDHAIPANIVISWSLNPPVIIKNEEHFTADLEQRLLAARTVVANGIKVAFHFHPMIYYQGWHQDYTHIAQTLINEFTPDQVLFVSFGSLTLIRPVIQKIRKLGHPTKILQMEFVADPLGKLTYPDAIKIEMFRKMYQAFQPWHQKVFIYLCMEKPEIWQQSFGFVYPNNDEFEKDFGRQTMAKV